MDSVARRMTMKETRARCFKEGYDCKDTGVWNDYPLNSYKNKAWFQGYNFREGYEAYPNFNCAYKETCYAYDFYLAGFNKRKNEEDNNINNGKRKKNNIQQK